MLVSTKTIKLNDNFRPIKIGCLVNALDSDISCVLSGKKCLGTGRVMGKRLINNVPEFASCSVTLHS